MANTYKITGYIETYCPYCGSRKTKYIDDVKDIDKFPWE